MQFTTEIVNFYQTPQDKRFIYSESIRSNWYMIMPLRGSFWYKLQNFEEGHVSFGSFVLCPPDRTFYRSNEMPLPFISIEFKWFDEHGVPYTTANQEMYGKITIHDIPRLTSTLHKFTEIKTTLLTEATFYRNHLLCDLLLSCSLEQRQQRMKKIEDHVVLHAIRHLEDNFEQPISLKALADHSFLSQSQFCRRFQAATGLSPIQYLTEIRLQKACYLLLETDYTIERIALECGYHNGFYFSRVFRKKYELSPSTYREQNSV